MGPTAVRIEPAYDDRAAVLDAIRAVDEWWPIARYAASKEEQAASGGTAGAVPYVPPWFRRDFALDGEALVPGADRVLHNPAFVAAAHEVFGADVTVAPSTVYVNVMLPSVVPFIAHTDVPAFRGFTRADHPIWLLTVMLHSGLFEAWRVQLATAVSWFYEGDGGTFHYWPDGAEAAPSSVAAPYGNVAVLADNERTYHGVGPVGTDGGFVQGLTYDTLLHRVEGGWEMRDGDRVLGSGTDDEVRITVSWKGEIHTGDEADDLLTIDRVVEVFRADLAARGVDVDPPTDPEADPDWVQTLSDHYTKQPPAVPDGV